jgi:chemosensory pili system protein ChpA (sensor histidine kinase/response regulator)
MELATDADATPDTLTSDRMNALAWVQAELRRSLEAAHKSLRRHLKDVDTGGRGDVDAVDLAGLRAARVQLHQGVGALEMIGLPAAAQVLRAAELLVQRLVGKPTLANAAAVQAVERVSFALLDFLSRQLAGKAVSPVMLFPQYQVAMQLAGAERVHPADLWRPDAAFPVLAPDPSALPRAADEAALAQMENGALTLMREPSARGFSAMSDLCAGLAAGVGRGPAAGQNRTLWQLAAAMFEAQGAGLLQGDVHTKRMASRLLAQLRASVRGAAAPAERLLQDLLFFCGHAKPLAAYGAPAAGLGNSSAVRAASGAAHAMYPPRLSAVRQAGKLDQWPSADYNVSRLGLFDPAQLALAKRRVAAAKDNWSAVAGGEEHRLAGLMDVFALVAESLAKLFPTGDKLAQALNMAAAQTVAANAAPAPELAMEVATAVLYLEAVLEDGELDQPELAQRVSHLAERVDSVRSGAAPKPLDIWMEDLYRRVSDRQTMGSVVHELRASLSNVEKQIDQYFRQPADRAVLFPVPAQLSAMRGVLSVLGLHQASQAALRMRDDVDALAQTVVDPQQAIQTGTFNRLADNLGALSFLIDMLSVQPQMAKSLFRFDATTGSLSAVMGQSDRVSAFADLEPGAPAPAAADLRSDAQRALSPSPEPDAQQVPPASLPLAAISLPAALTPAAPAAAFGVEPSRSVGDVPPLHGHAQRSDTQPEPAQVLDSQSMALSSGAPVPAPSRLQALAASAMRPTTSDDEFGQQLEQVAAQAQAADERELAALLGRAQSRLRASVDPDTSRLVRAELAKALVERIRAPVPEPLPPAAPVPPPRPAPLGGTGLEDDQEMREIFVEEAREVIANAGAALQRLADTPDNTSDLTVVRRAFHTLKGSSRMLGLRDFGEAAWSCEQLYNARLAQMAHLDEPTRTLSAEALDYLASWVDAIESGVHQGHDAAVVAQALEAMRLHGERRPIPSTSAAAPGLVAPLASAASAEHQASTVLRDEAASNALQERVPGLPSAFDLTLDPTPDLSLGVHPSPALAPDPGLGLDLDLDILAPMPLPSTLELLDEGGVDAAAQSGADAGSPAATTSPELPGLAGTARLPDFPDLPDLDAFADLPQVQAKTPAVETQDLPDLPAIPELPEVPEIPEVQHVSMALPDPGIAPVDLELDLGQLDDGPGFSTRTLPLPYPELLPRQSPPRASAPVAQALDHVSDSESEPIHGVDPQAATVSEPPQPSPAALSPTAIETGEVFEDELAELDDFFGFKPDPSARFGRPTEPGELDPVTGELVPAPQLVSLLSSLPSAPVAPPPPGWAQLPGDWSGLDLDLGLPGPQTTQVPQVPVQQSLVEPVALPLHEPAVQPPSPGAADPGVLVAAELAAQEAAVSSPAAPEPAVSDDEDEPFKMVGPLRIPIPLFNIFLNEADELSRRLVTELAEWALEWQMRPVPESSVALAHSLAGNSGTVGGVDLCALARSLEHALARSAEHACGRPGEAGLFSDAAEEIRRLLHQFAAGFLREVNPAIVERLAAHERLPVHAKPDTKSDVEPARDYGPEDDLSLGLEPKPGQGPSELPAQETDGLAAVGNNLSARPADEVIESVAHLPADTADQRPDVAAAVEPASSLTFTATTPTPDLDSPAASAASPSNTAPLPALRLVGTGARADALDDDRDIDAQDQIDSELFPIFEEEAEELLPQLQSRLRDWMHKPADAAAPAACMRTLHTFKGGARLAGAMRLGELAHRLETAIEHLAARAEIHLQDIERLLGRGDAMAAAFESLCKRPLAQPVAGPVATEAAPAAAPAAPWPLPTPPANVADVPAALPVVQGEHSPQVPASAIDWSRFADSQVVAAAAETRSAPVAAVRVRASLLDRLVNQAGEVSITRSRIDADVKQLQVALGELTESLERMRRQLRDIEVQAETQISSRLEAAKATAQSFDPLEMDRFTRFQELTRFMAESVNDVATLQRGLQRTLQSTEDELAAQARLTRELQDDLLRTRMVEFESQSDRLYRTVRQAAKDSGKSVKMDIVGGAIEIDRGVLDRMMGPFEHLLRNGVAHGVEAPVARRQAGKPADGHITITVAQAGNEVAVDIADDGGGLDLPRIREQAVSRGLLAPDAPCSDAELAQMIFQPGFSTAEQVTELAGRGVGLDVVRSEVMAMGGRIETQSQPGLGTTMRLRLPLTTAVTQVVRLRCADLVVAVPTTLVEAVRRVTSVEVDAAYTTGDLQVAGEALPFYWLASLMGMQTQGTVVGRTQTVVLIRSALQRVAVHVDEVLGNQEVVVKNVGPQLARLPGLAGVTLLPSGAVALIYNPVALANVYGVAVRQAYAERALAGRLDGSLSAVQPSTVPGSRAAAQADAPDAGSPLTPGTGVSPAAQAPLVMVVDDSLTVRRVTQRLLLREGYRVVTAKDGMEALELLAKERPSVLLSDIEMPRMDGFDLVRNVRSDPGLVGLPVMMITSRTAQKHRDVAKALGADHFLGKPYSEDELLSVLAGLVSAAAQAGAMAPVA